MLTGKSRTGKTSVVPRSAASISRTNGATLSCSLNTGTMTEIWGAAPETGEALVERARDLSRDPRHEDVLVLAHGPDDDGENQRWLAQIDARADTLRQALPFRRVQVETLREDWPEKRKAAETRIRAFVEQAEREGARAIVLPFRVQGFGPYAEVLKGLAYVHDGRGLVPGPQVGRWVRRQVEELRAAEFHAPIDKRSR